MAHARVLGPPRRRSSYSSRLTTQASASFPENTRMSFIEACKAGADGIETGEC